MSLSTIFEPRGTKTHYIPFHEHSPKISIEGHEFYEYISHKKMDSIISDLLDKVSLENYEAVIVNNSGGQYLLKHLKEKKNYYDSIVEVEYHRPDNGIGVRVDISIPQELKDRKCLIIEDIHDRGDTLEAMLNDCGDGSRALVVVRKRDIQKQKAFDDRVEAGVEIDDVWVGGCGMNIEVDGDNLPKGFLRDYGGLVVKIGSS